LLATFVIGLREGLEAALVVSIIATFLRRNGSSLVPLVVGVVVAVSLSIAVGIALWLVETNLPQAAQEGMETVIGAIAVCFVTGMVLWMRVHARGMKRELESATQRALGSGSSRALALMAFLAVLKEGFETAVFLLATFSAAGSTGLAAGGAALGLLCACLLGYGLYTGGVRLNLSRFFTFTAGFIVLVAAGLVMTAIGTAHEAGWLNAGQQHTVDLSWLSPPGSVRGALITGVLGIPPQPVLIQVVGWLAYLISMTLCVFWPARHRPHGASATRIRMGVAGLLGGAAVALALLVPPASLPSLGAAKLVDARGEVIGSIRVAGDEAAIRSGISHATMSLGGGRAGTHLGVGGAVLYSQHLNQPPAGLPRTLSLQQLLAMNGGSLPVGFSVDQAPGPFHAAWTRSGDRRLWLVKDQVLDFDQQDATAVTLTGGGLETSRTLAVTGRAPGGVLVGGGSMTAASRHVQAAENAALEQSVAETDRRFWGRTLPIILTIVTVALLLWSARTSRVSTVAPGHSAIGESVTD
jgi:high-affinity iron transporter